MPPYASNTKYARRMVSDQRFKVVSVEQGFTVKKVCCWDVNQIAGVQVSPHSGTQDACGGLAIKQRLVCCC
jgi:hypothetical protein